jgi:nitrous oxidase accessory protein NosD
LGSGIDVRNGVILNYTNGPWNNFTAEGCVVRNIWHRALYGATGSGHSFRANSVTNARGMGLESAGIMLYGAQGEILGNTVRDCGIGISTHAGSSGEISGNDIYTSELGILTNGTNVASLVHNNLLQSCDQGVQLIGLAADVTVENNTFLECGWGLSFFGSNGQGFVQDNLFDGHALGGNGGIFATTDLAPWGENNVFGTVARNQFRNLDTGILLDETVVSLPQTMGLVIGGSALESNTFRGNTSFNLALQGTDDDINATWNSWGAASASLIGVGVWDQLDEPALGLVDISNPVVDQVVVANNGSGDFLTIQEGINAVDSGGTVIVKVGHYVGSLVISKSLQLLGSGSDPNPSLGTSIFGNNLAAGVGNDVVTVLSPNVEIRDLRIDAWSVAHNDRFGAGLIYDHADSGVISGVHVERATYGIYVYYSNGVTVTSSEVLDCGVDLSLGGGIFYRGSTGTIGGLNLGNLAENCGGTGILMHNSSSGLIEGNLAKNCGLGYLCNGAAAYTLLQYNGATACNQGFQMIGNNAPVDILDNTSRSGSGTGFALYGIGAQLHQFRGNTSDGVGTAYFGMYVNPNTQWGSSDIHATFRDNSFLDANYGVFIDEAGNNSYLMDLDFYGGGLDQNRITGHNFFAVYLDNCDDLITMPLNFWGTTDMQELENRIFHRNDVLTLGLVDFGLPQAPEPTLRVNPVLLTTGDKVQLLMTGRPGDPFRVAAGFTPGTWNTPYGTLGLSQAASKIIIDDIIPASGVFVTRLETVGVDRGTVLVQGGVAGSVGAISNLETFELY